MSEAELISACLKNDKAAKKQFFETYYSKLGYISLRYSKNSAQAEQITLKGFSQLFVQLAQFRSQTKQNLEEFATHQFISFVVDHIKGIRNEYYVASTIRAVEITDHTYDLFLDSGLIDLKSSNPEIILKSIQELVPSQRLAFNLHVIDNYSLSTISELLETSEQTIKSNLEKARFNLQKGIEKNLKLSNNEQPV
jgi:RNA polymerase sigma factor (sigma-70 family)